MCYAIGRLEPGRVHFPTDQFASPTLPHTVEVGTRVGTQQKESRSMSWDRVHHNPEGMERRNGRASSQRGWGGGRPANVTPGITQHQPP